MMRRLTSPSALLLSAFLSASCSSPAAGPEGPWQGERTEEDGVTVVRTRSGSLWEGTTRLVEEASIGSLEGEDAYVLGSVRSIAVGGGRIYVLDTQVPVVRAYDLEGSHLFDVGREGDGPGEYRQPESIVIRPRDGHLFVRQAHSGRVDIFTPQGDPAGRWQVRSGWGLSRPSLFTEDGTYYNPGLLNLGAPVEEWSFGLIAYGPEGATGDTLRPPEYQFEPWQLVARGEEGGTSVNPVPFSPRVGWTVGPDGTMVAGVSEAYRLDVTRRDGERMRIERDYDPVPVGSEEEDWHRRASIANMRSTQEGWAWNGPEIPAHKPVFNDLLVDRDGRIWVQRPGPGIRQENCAEDPFTDSSWWRNPCWIDSALYDVFAPDGRYLGPVDAPTGFHLDSPRPWIEGDRVVAYVEGEDGTPRVKVFRLQRP